eukprot:gene11039-3745_t
MGWNTWNKFGCNINENLIKSTADVMISSGLSDLGYKYINIDDCWENTSRENGKLIPDPNTFPSGMKNLSDYIHSLGLKIGIYSSAGHTTCEKRPGSLNYEEVDAKTFAEWGIDYLKYDNCGNDENINGQIRFKKMYDSLKNSGRDIYYSVCQWGEKDPEDPAKWVSTYGNSWRTTGDVKDNYYIMNDIIDHNNLFAQYSRLNHWNDPDMLEVGNDKLTFEEYKTHFSLWAISKAPLIIGCDLNTIKQETKDILMNKEVININQDSLGIQGRKVFSFPSNDKDTSIMVRKCSNSPLENWKVEANGLIKNGERCLKSSVDGKSVYVSSSCDQFWKISPIGDKFNIKMKNDEMKCLSVWKFDNAGVEYTWNGPNLITSSCDPLNSNQQFNISGETILWEGNILHHMPSHLQIKNPCVTVDSTYEIDIWSSTLENGKTAILIHNRGLNSAEVSLDFSRIGITFSQVSLRDVWKKREIGSFTDTFKTTIGSHSVVMLVATDYFLLFKNPLKTQEVQLNCITWKNSFVKIYKQNLRPEVLRFEIHSRQSQGWIGISFFSQKSKFEDALAIVGYQTNNFVQLTNHTTFSTQKSFFEATTVDQLYNTIDAIFAFSFKINATELQNKKYIVFSNNLYETPFIKNNQTFIPRHDSYSLYKYIQLNKTKTQLPICENSLNMSGRIYGQHYGGMIFALGIYCLLGILFVYFRDHQPFKSRFVGPFIALGAVYFNLVIEHIYVLILFETKSRIYCFLTPFLAYGFLQVAFVVPFLMLFRYILLLQIHQNKRKIIKELKLKEKETKIEDSRIAKLKKVLSFILKITSSHWIVLIFPVIWATSFEILQFAAIAYNDFSCTERAYSMQRLIHSGFIGIVFLLIISVLIFDFICNIPLIFRCQWKKIFIQNDPYHYRLDMLAFLLIIPPTIIWLGFELPTYMFSIIVEIIMFLGLYTSGLQAFLITLINRIRHSRQKMKHNSRAIVNVETILKPIVLEIFIQFCESEWSSENIFLKLDILEYKKSKSSQERENLCWIIKERYLLVNVSPLELNCPSSILNKSLREMDEKKFSDDLFYDIENNVDMNLMDTISRFKYSSLYQIHLKDMEQQNKILGL